MCGFTKVPILVKPCFCLQPGDFRQSTVKFVGQSCRSSLPHPSDRALGLGNRDDDVLSLGLPGLS